MIGTTVGRFRIIELLGQGAFGEVYMAEDERIGQKVAIKRLPLTDSLEAREDLRREARAAARLDHPNIAHIIELIEAEDNSLLVMEFVKGRNLAEVLQDGPLEPPLVTEIAIQLSGALDVAHSARVLHRDLKPANIQFTDRQQIKILDFGLARVHRAYPGSNAPTTSLAPGLSSTGGIVGTPAYIPPEMFQNERADHRGDIYSAGVTLFELATGRRPYMGADIFALIEAVRSHPIPHAHEVNPKVSSELSRVIRRAMARDPAERFQSAAEMKAAFEGVGAGSGGIGWRRVLVPVAVVAVVLSIMTLARNCDKDPTQSEIAIGPSVLAVLPVRFQGADTSASYLAAGMTDFLTASLANFPLTVVPPERDEPANQAPAAVAARLGATLLLDASLMQSGEQVQVTLKLLSRDGKTVRWSDVFNGRSEDIFATHQKAVGRLSSGLEKLGAIPAQSGEDLAGRPVSPPTESSEAWAEYSQAIRFLEATDNLESVDRAITLFKSAIDHDPRFAMAYAGLGRALLAGHRPTDDLSWLNLAREAIITAQALGSRRSSVRLALANAEEDLSNFAAAESIAMSVAHEFPRNDDAFNRAGSAVLELGRNEEALELFDHALQIRPEYWRNHYSRGRALHKLNRKDEAVKAMIRATELQPDNILAWGTLGAFRQGAGDTANARIAYRRALQLGPRVSVYSNLGSLDFNGGNFTAALENFRRAVMMSPGKPQYRRNLADAWTELDQPDSAKVEYEHGVRLCKEILAIKPKDSSTMAVMATCLAKLGRYNEALAQIDHALQIDRTSAEFLYRRAGVLSMASRPKEALEALSTAIQEGYSRAEANASRDLDGIRGSAEFRRLVHTK